MKIEATAKGTTGRTLSTSAITFPATKDHEAFAKYLGGMTNVCELALRQAMVSLQGRLRTMAADPKKVYNQTEVDKAALETLETLRQGPAAKVAKVDRIAKDAASLSPEDRAALIAALQAAGSK